MQAGSNSIAECFLCGNQPKGAKFDITTHSYAVTCPVCGPYRLHEFAKTTLDLDSSNEKRYALAWIIQDLSYVAKNPITDDAVDDLVREGLAREPTPSGKARLLLQTLKRRSRAFGRGAKFNRAQEWPSIKARGLEECDSIIDELQSRGLLRNPEHFGDDTLALGWDAWQMLEPLTGGAAKTAFVAMAFHPDLEACYELGIKAAIERAGLVPIRLDKETFSEKICERILMEIHSAEFVIADFTHQRGGVYFEAGYALGLRKQIVWVCREDDVENLHFDTRQYPYILWSTTEDLASRLEERLRYLLLQTNERGGA
jgi:nucleoside 2-deoxyribosyltransferase